MRRIKFRNWKTIAICGLALGLAWGVSGIAVGKPKPPKEPPPPSTHDLIVDLQLRVAELEMAAADFDQVLKYAYVSEETINGLPGPHVLFEGCNVHVRNGAGATYDSENGLGNLIIGYNEIGGDPESIFRTGSHNVAIGSEHSYYSSGGFVAGKANTIGSVGASVYGGRFNEASGEYSTICGGQNNGARALDSAILGGEFNAASGEASVVVGGQAAETRGAISVVLGGLFVTTSAVHEIAP